MRSLPLPNALKRLKKGYLYFCVYLFYLIFFRQRILIVLYLHQLLPHSLHPTHLILCLPSPPFLLFPLSHTQNQRKTKAGKQKYEKYLNKSKTTHTCAHACAHTYTPKRQRQKQVNKSMEFVLCWPTARGHGSVCDTLSETPSVKTHECLHVE